MIAGGGIALSVGLIAHFGSAVSVAAIAAPSWMDGLGMAMLGLAFVPNAMIAGAGYVTAVGFEIGPGPTHRWPPRPSTCRRCHCWPQRPNRPAGR